MGSPGVGGTISAASDVSFNNPSEGQVIQRNGSYWVNGTASGMIGATGPTGPQGPAGSGSSWNFRTVTANTTAAVGELLLVDTTSQAVTVTLPSPALNAIVRVKRMNVSGNGIEIRAPSGTYIDSVAVGTVTMNQSYSFGDVVSDGVAWYRV